MRHPVSSERATSQQLTYILGSSVPFNSGDLEIYIGVYILETSSYQKVRVNCISQCSEPVVFFVQRDTINQFCKKRQR